MTYRIGLELTALETDHRTRGIGRVAQAYFEYLSDDGRVELVPYTQGDFPSVNSNGSSHWSSQLVDPFKISWFLRNESPDLFQVIDPMKVPSFTSTPVVTMVHDLIPYLYRERYQTNLWSKFLHWRMKNQVRHSDFIITPSKCTADDLTMLFEVDRERVQPVYHGIDHDRFYPMNDDVVAPVLERYDVDHPYFLMVADLSHYDPRKKLEDVVDHWNYDLLNGVNLVVVGQRGEYSERLRNQWEGPDADILFPGFVNDDELAAFYSGARALIFPSRYEGFGFPVIESMACGTKPIVRGVGSVEEIVGDAAVVLGEESYSNQLMDALADQVSNRDPDEECIEHASHFTWEQTVEELLDVYERLDDISEEPSSEMSKE